MPHLSPMNWIMAILVFWIFLLSLSTSNWWSQPMKFPSSSSIKSKHISNTWKWHL